MELKIFFYFLKRKIKKTYLIIKNKIILYYFHLFYERLKNKVLDINIIFNIYLKTLKINEKHFKFKIGFYFIKYKTIFKNCFLKLFLKIITKLGLSYFFLGQ